MVCCKQTDVAIWEWQSQDRGEGVNLSAGLCILLLLPGPPISQKKTSLYQLQEKICLKQTLCAPIRLKSQAQCSGVANIPSITILSEDTQNVLYFPCILLRLRRMLAVVLEEGVCGRSVLLVHPWLKVQLTYTSFRRDLETHFSWK